jgi:thiosulfate dehydrogenase [quinone] large subunit
MADQMVAERERASVRVAFWAATLAPFAWLVVRGALGWVWLRAAWDKLGDAGWTAAPRGSAVTGYLNGAVSNATGAHPEVSNWFAHAIDRFFLPNAEFLAYVVAIGELLIGLALIIGLFTRMTALIAAAFNVLLMWAGTSSTNPQMILLELAIVFVGVGAGTYGVDYWILPWLRKLVGEDFMTFARDVTIGAGIVFGAWMVIVTSANWGTWAVIAAIAAGVAIVWELVDRGLFHHTRAAPGARVGTHA